MKNIVAVLSLVSGVALAEIKVDVVGVQVTGKGYVAEGQNDVHALKPFNWHAGTRVGLMVTTDGKTMIGVDEDKSKVTAFTDDLETNFLESKGRFGRKGAKFDRPDLGKDRKGLVIHVESPGLPKKGAKTFTLKGEIVVLVGGESKLVKSKAAELKKGSKLVVGEHTFEIIGSGKPDWGDDPLEIELQSSVSHEDFKAFEFYDAEGKKIESERGGSSSMTNFGKRTCTVTFRLKKKVDQVILGLDMWTDLEEVKVPLDLTFGVGL